MLGTRGVRLGRHQARPVRDAGARPDAGRGRAGGGRRQAQGRGHDPADRHPRGAGAGPSWVEEAIAAETPDLRKKPEVTIGTMIETPRAAVRADEIAEEADFFSFGTNDLTQMTFGFSRDDVEGRMMSAYLEQGLLKRNPFETIDQAGSVSWSAEAVERGRADPARPEARRVRRARRRPGVDRLLLPGRARLRVVLAVPGPYRPAGGRPGRSRSRLTAAARQPEARTTNRRPAGAGAVLRSWRGDRRRGHRQGPRSSTDFVAVAGEHMALRRVGSRWVGLCPFHNEKTPSFSVNAELGFYYCFGCGAKGDVITFVRELEHLDFVEAVEKLAARAGVALRYDDQAAGRDHQRRARMHETLERAIDWYHERLLGSAGCGGRPGVICDASAATTAMWCAGTGWAGRPRGGTNWSAPWACPRPLSWTPGWPRWTNRAATRISSAGGCSFPSSRRAAGRSGPAAGCCPGAGAPSTRTLPARPSTTRAGCSTDSTGPRRRWSAAGRVVVCEGYTDVIGLQRAGIGEAVATCGTALAEGHIRLLTNFATRIVLAYDADAAGQAAAERCYEWERRFEVDIRVAVLPAGADPADLAQQDPDALTTAVAEAQPYLGFRLDRLFGRADLRTPEGRARAAAEAMGW